MEEENQNHNQEQSEEERREQIRYGIHDLFYANGIGIDVGASEFILTFTQDSPDGIVDQKSIAINPVVANQLSELIRND